MKKQLEIGDKIQRFEVAMTREIDYVYVIDNITKTLAKSGDTIFKRELNYETTKPINSKNKIIAMVYKKEKQDFTSPTYFLIEEDYESN